MSTAGSEGEAELVLVLVAFLSARATRREGAWRRAVSPVRRPAGAAARRDATERAISSERSVDREKYRLGI